MGVYATRLQDAEEEAERALRSSHREGAERAVDYMAGMVAMDLDREAVIRAVCDTGE